MLLLNAVCVLVSPLPLMHTLAMCTLLNATIALSMEWRSLLPYVKFAYNCFLKPFVVRSQKHQGGHQSLLEQFYQGQADIYDDTRKKLLAGRSTMLRLCAAQLKQVFLKQED